jgi:hypothetical protein
MAEYTHRKKADGTWDSICMTCYRTAAKSDTELELGEDESMHKCDGSPWSRQIDLVIDSLRKWSD